MDENALSDELEAALEQLRSVMPPSECHGVVSGLLCADNHFSRDAWLARFREEAPAEGAAVREALELLGLLFDRTGAQLADPLLEFTPLLAEEDAPLEQRLEALGAWCQGFLFGLAAGGVREMERLPDESAEAVRDLVEISGVHRYEADDAEEDEQAYMELVEFVRTAVLLINEELNPVKAPPRDGVTRH